MEKPSDSAQPIHVLVIDDDEPLRRMIVEALTSHGYLVHPAANGAEGLRHAREHRPDLILLDIRMPGVNGWQVLDELRAVAGQQTPVVIMTAGFNAQDQALSTGAQGYLGKPFELEDLISAVEAHGRLRLTGGTEEPLITPEARS